MDGPTTPCTVPVRMTPRKWVGAWGDAIDNNLGRSAGETRARHDRSFRSVVTPTIGGTIGAGNAVFKLLRHDRR